MNDEYKATLAKVFGQLRSGYLLTANMVELSNYLNQPLLPKWLVLLDEQERSWHNPII